MSLMITTNRAQGGGRRHLDGSVPGTGLYLVSISVTLRPEDVALLEQIGDGNRSEAVRRLLASHCQTRPVPAAEPTSP